MICLRLSAEQDKKDARNKILLLKKMSAVIIQRKFKTNCQKEKFNRLKLACIRIQKTWRKFRFLAAENYKKIIVIPYVYIMTHLKRITNIVKQKNAAVRVIQKQWLNRKRKYQS